MKHAIVIAVDGTSASGKSTTSRMLAKMLGLVYVDTGAMYRTLGWYCLRNKIDVTDHRAVATTCRKWNTSLDCVDKYVRLLVDGIFPENELRNSEVSAATSHIAVIPKVREWMKKKQRECIQFGSLVMEGRDIGTNVFPETDFKYYLDAHLEERARRRAAEGVIENLAARDQRDSQRAAAPLMIALGARVIDTSKLTIEATCKLIIEDLQQKGAKLEPVAA
jgi:cytidylate kinase